MKFVHIADMHFDRQFVKLSDKDILGDLRRLEQRKVFKKIIEYIKNNNIKYFFISGDLYEHKYVRQSTIEYINKLFKEISNNWEIRITLSISGVVLFVSQFEIVLLLTNSLSARSSWVNPIDFLLVCNTSPKFI